MSPNYMGGAILVSGVLAVCISPLVPQDAVVPLFLTFIFLPFLGKGALMAASLLYEVHQERQRSDKVWHALQRLASAGRPWSSKEVVEALQLPVTWMEDGSARIHRGWKAPDFDVARVDLGRMPELRRVLQYAQPFVLHRELKRLQRTVEELDRLNALPVAFRMGYSAEQTPEQIGSTIMSLIIQMDLTLEDARVAAGLPPEGAGRGSRWLQRLDAQRQADPAAQPGMA